MPELDPFEPGKKLQDLLKSPEDLREWRFTKQETSNIWKKFWIRLMVRQGYSNVQIAKRLDITEGTVRYHKNRLEKP